MAFECSICAPGAYTTDLLAHMKSHLGSTTFAHHNMGPFLCQFTGCRLRSARGNYNVRHGNPPHQVQFAKDTGLENASNTMALQCRVGNPPSGSVPSQPAPPGPPPPPGSGGTAPGDAGAGSGTGSDGRHVGAAPYYMEPNLPGFDSPYANPPGSPFSAATIDPLAEYGAELKGYFNEHVTPTLKEGLRLLRDHEPEKPLRALGKFLLGEDAITGCERVPFDRQGVRHVIEEGTKILAVSKPKLEDPLKWFGKWLCARSAELEED